MAITCLDTLVGLTDLDCNCISGIPSDAGTSDSGYYLTDRDYGIPFLPALAANVECGEGSLWDVLEKARTSAIGSINTDLPALLKKHYDKVILPYSGQVGMDKFSSERVLTTEYAGQQIWSRRRIKDAYFVVTGITTIWNQTLTGQTITITSNNPDFDDQTLEVDSSAGARQANSLDEEDYIYLPLYSEVCYEARYSFSYELSGGLQPYDNIYYCCSYRPPWKSHIGAGGFNLDDVSDVNDSCYSSNAANGLIIHGFFKCDNLAWICNLKELDGYDFLDVLARTIQFRAGVELATAIIDSSQINYWTTLTATQLMGKRNHYWKRYNDNLLWMVQNLPQRSTGCYQCSKPMIRKGSL